VGNPSKVLGLNHFITSWEQGEKSTGKLPKFKFLETPTNGITRE